MTTAESARPARMIAVWCPDWPVVAAHHHHVGQGGRHHSASQADIAANVTDEPIAVITANLVVACSHQARMAGVRRGMRRREAQSRCPDLVVLPRDEIGEARAFEPVVSAIESIAPGVEITRPGLAAIGAQGPTRYFGGETAVVHALSRRLGELNAVAADVSTEGPYFPGSTTARGSVSTAVGSMAAGSTAVGSTAGARTAVGSTAVGSTAGARIPIGDVLIGAADGSFAAEHAARRGIMVPPGQSARFLADLPIETADSPELVDLLRRLGIRTLGAFADLPARDVLARFGPGGAWVHRQCGGRDARPIAARSPATEHTVDIVFEPALDRVDAIAFSARTGAERFIDGLLAHGLACTCLELIAQTDNGEETVRSWRQNGVLTSVDVLDRIRWQLEGWLHGGIETSGIKTSGIKTSGIKTGGYGPDRRSVGGPDRPTAGVTLLRLAAVQVVPIGAHQQSLWSGAGADDERAHRALARVQTLLGHGSVVTAVVDGGREPAERTRLVAWGDKRGGDTAPVVDHTAHPPWPGHIPAPAPSVLIDPPRPVRVLDAAGRPVTITARGAVPAPPTRLALDAGAPVTITAWAGPWPVDDAWWKETRWQQTQWQQTQWKETQWQQTQPQQVRPGDGTPALRRRARFQLVDVQGRAYLVTCTVPLISPASPGPPGDAVDSDHAQWTLDALYD